MRTRIIYILCLLLQGLILGFVYPEASPLKKVNFAAEQSSANNESKDMSSCAGQDLAENSRAPFLAAEGMEPPQGPLHTVSPMGLFAQILIVLLLLFIGGCTLVRWAKRKGIVRGQNENKLQICEMKALGNRQFLLVVEYESQKILLGVSPQQIQQLAYLSSPFAKIQENDEVFKENP